MYKTNFKGKSVNAYAKRNVLTISNFAGVDYTDSALNVPSNHALDILNLYLKDNVIQKRSGLKHLFSLESEKKVHKVYEFNNSLIVHIGTHLFVLDKENFDTVKSFTDKDYLLDKEVTFIEKNDKLFILGGIKYFYLDKDFNMFNAEDYSYVPTTTIGIVNTFVPSNDIQNEDTNRTSLDKVNNLSSLVINELISGVRINEDTKLVDYNTITKYQLDNNIDLDNYDKISIKLDIDLTDLYYYREVVINSGSANPGGFGIFKLSGSNNAWFNFRATPAPNRGVIPVINATKSFDILGITYKKITDDEYFIYFNSEDSYINEKYKCITDIGNAYFYVINNNEKNDFLGLKIDENKSDANWKRILFYQDFEKRSKYPNEYIEVARYEVTKLNDSSETKIVYENQLTSTTTIYTNELNYYYFLNKDVSSTKNISGTSQKDFVIKAYDSNDNVIASLEF